MYGTSCRPTRARPQAEDRPRSPRLQTRTSGASRFAQPRQSAAVSATQKRADRRPLETDDHPLATRHRAPPDRRARRRGSRRGRAGRDVAGGAARNQGERPTRLGHPPRRRACARGAAAGGGSTRAAAAAVEAVDHRLRPPARRDPSPAPSRWRSRRNPADRRPGTASRIGGRGYAPLPVLNRRREERNDRDVVSCRPRRLWAGRRHGRDLHNGRPRDGLVATSNNAGRRACSRDLAELRHVPAMRRSQ